MMAYILEVLYLVAAVTFMIGLKMLSKPDTARKGNLIAAFGMTLAIFATIFIYRDSEGNHLGNLVYIFVALALGTIIGYFMAMKVQMTAMPQMVSFFNGMGGACAAIISIIEFGHLEHLAAAGDTQIYADKIFIILAGLVIGSVSFAGSMIAYGKLEGKIGDYNLPGQIFINVGLLFAILISTVLFGLEILSGVHWFYIILIVSTLYGFLFVFPIGGADMPVVISLLNSFTGVAAACGGFLYDNYVMLIGGILVGSAGTILTITMCNAMNRSLLNVLLGNFGGSSGGASGSGEQGSVKEISLSDASVLMKYAKKVVIVPGYGLAVAQAQHICHELETLLEDEGVVVKYAIHPVAGRMPGHMNVLLAESNVSYDKLVEMEDINPEFPTTDVVLVVGANDVVNPAAKTDPTSPIYGMHILEVEDAKNIIILKRSMKAGYAGIENELFFRTKCFMLFGDAKDSITKLVTEIKNS
jgi:H+-translocating NAD(P) transhydrogenase subunit beta